MCGRLRDSTTFAIAAGDLDAVFLPGRGMIGASLRHRGVELLRQVEELEAMAVKGSAAGIPLLYPWANRLGDYGYRAEGREVELDSASPFLHFDERGLPIHGVPWSRLVWEVTEATHDSVAARLEWNRDELLGIFPFRHHLEMAVTLQPDGLTIETTVISGSDVAVPVSFGFHPYFGLPGLPRLRWRLRLPAMRRFLLDRRMIPTGKDEPFSGFDAELGVYDFDDGFSLSAGSHSFSIEGGGRRIAVEFMEGYNYAQVYAPKGYDYIALEPMTAPTNALVTGRGLRLAKPGGRFRAVFRIRIDALP
jgi:aldose 1-epimerase